MYGIDGIEINVILGNILFHCRRKIGCKLLKVPTGIKEESSAFLDILNDFANTTNAHVHLIAHSRKDENEFSPPGKLDVKGSGDITDLASNVWSVWRNKVKEEDLAKLDAGEPVKLSRSEIEGKPDALLMCVKARDDRGEEGKVGLFFHKTSLQYLERRHNSPTRYVLMDETAADDDIDINVEVVNDAC